MCLCLLILNFKRSFTENETEPLRTPRPSFKEKVMLAKVLFHLRIVVFNSALQLKARKSERMKLRQDL